MLATPFHALYEARELSSYTEKADKLSAAYASSNIEIYPYQVAAALFALRSPYLKGVVLADEGSLGKTYEALLVISQMWYEGKERILLVVPTPLLHQWWGIIQDCFSVPFQIHAVGDCDFDFQGIILTTYDFAVQNAERIGSVAWDIVVFEEAHRLSNTENKTTIALKEAVGDAYKILLTATPMQNDIMDLFGLIHFIDNTVLGDGEEFYKRYFRKPELYHELTSRVSRYVFRTLRSQVQGYVKIPRRLPVTADYQLTADELLLSAMLGAYIQKPNKTAFPKMDAWELSLMLWRSLSSSTFAFNKLLHGAIEREPEPELVAMRELTTKITVNAKGQELLKVLKKAFVELKKRGANRKALIFTENRATQQYLNELLTSAGYNTLTYNGEKSREYDIIKRFESEADILVSTDIAAEGFHLAHCSFLVNYDLPYNVLGLEQRILRCHRQGQQNDVVVLNFLNKTNLADTRILELINKRVMQFDGIMGMSDDVVGNFADNAVDGATKAFESARIRADVEREYQAALAHHEAENMEAVSEAENVLFTTFTRDIASKITVTPQYIKDKAAEINRRLWELVAPLLETNGYVIDRKEQTATLPADEDPPHLFYYWTGSRNAPYKGLRAYGANKDFKPIGGRITLASPIGRGTLHNTECADEGTITIDGATNCKLAFYIVNVNEKGHEGTEYHTFAGKTDTGEVLSDERCRELMGLPVQDFTESDRRSPSWLKSSTGRGRPNELDGLVDLDLFKSNAVMDTSEARREEAESIKDRAYHKKQALNRDISVLKNQLLQIENALSRTSAVADKIDAEKKKATANKDLKKREQTLFLDSIRVDADADAAIKTLTEQVKLSVSVYRQFLIQITGGSD